MNTDFTEAFLSDCAASLSVANPDFHSADYKDGCFCKKNLEYVIRQVRAESTKEARHAVAKHYAEIIARNNATMPRGCPCDHVWVLSQRNLSS
jgi:hypothetical protein